MSVICFFLEYLMLIECLNESGGTAMTNPFFPATSS